MDIGNIYINPHYLPENLKTLHIYHDGMYVVKHLDEIPTPTYISQKSNEKRTRDNEHVTPNKKAKIY